MRRVALLLAALAAPALVSCAHLEGSAETAETLPSEASVLTAMERVADWQLAHLNRFDHVPLARSSVRNPRDWQQATFWIALTELGDRSASSRYRQALLDHGARTGWRLGDKVFHADDHLIGQSYLWAERNGAGNVLGPTIARFEEVLAKRQTSSLAFIPGPPGSGDPPCTVRWCWCDALFMAPPTLLQLANRTGDRRYASFAHEEFWATTDYLYDKQEKLFFRDSRFFDQRDARGRKLFWSRGNGWVLSGLARIIAELAADDPMRPRYVALYKDMAARIAGLQKPDGYWAPSLLARDDATPPESSGTGFYTHALAWGINEGLLDRATFLPVVLKGWAALQRAIDAEGRLGWVQQVSDRPESVKQEDTQFYGTGAFLLAGSEVYDLVRGGRDRSASATLNVRQTDGLYTKVGSFAVPASHSIHDGLIAFEGPGWESDRVAYRLYLDERNAIDIFGKKVPAPVLGRVGIGKDDYHAMSGWGMDIFKAGDTVGVGGIGKLREGKPVQLGHSNISAAIEAAGPRRAAVRVTNRGWEGESGPADLTTLYEIEAGSRITHVTASATAPVIAGLTLHPGMSVLRSDAASRWRYIAAYGQQSLAGDRLGIALFYPADGTSEPVEGGGTLYIRFANPAAIRYAFAAAWEQESAGIKDQPSFRMWLDKAVQELSSR